MATSHSKKAGRECIWGLSNSEDMQRAAQARQGWLRSCIKRLMEREASKFRFFKVLLVGKHKHRRQKEIIHFSACFHYCSSVPSELKLTEAQLGKHKPKPSLLFEITATSCSFATSLTPEPMLWEFKICWTPKDMAAWMEPRSLQPACSCSPYPLRWTGLPRRRAGSKGLSQHD